MIISLITSSPVLKCTGVDVIYEICMRYFGMTLVKPFLCVRISIFPPALKDFCSGGDTNDQCQSRHITREFDLFMGRTCLFILWPLLNSELLWFVIECQDNRYAG
jgi:hypothetical protein